MKKLNHEKKYKVKRITAKAVFMLLSLLLIPTYTLIFGTKESPWEFSLSNIGNFFTHRLAFIIWGILTGMGIAFYTLYLYEKMDFSDKKARRYIISSVIFLVLAVITPALKETLPIYYYMHVILSGLFALFFIISIILFIQFLAKSNQRLSKTAIALLISCVGVSIVSMFIMGLNGVVEILFFIGISIFLAGLSIVLNRFKRQTEIEEQKIEIDRAKKQYDN